LKHNLDNITSQKWGARHIGEPHDHKSGGLEPLGPIGVYAYVSTPLVAWRKNGTMPRCTQARKATHGKTWTGLSVEESIRMTEDRDKWRKYVRGVATLGSTTAKEQNRRPI